MDEPACEMNLILGCQRRIWCSSWYWKRPWDARDI